MPHLPHSLQELLIQRLRVSVPFPNYKNFKTCFYENLSAFPTTYKDLKVPLPINSALHLQLPPTPILWSSESTLIFNVGLTRTEDSGIITSLMGEILAFLMQPVLFSYCWGFFFITFNKLKNPLKKISEGISTNICAIY